VVRFATGSTTVARIAEMLGGSVEGDGSREAVGVSPIEQADRETISFIANPRYRRFLSSTKAAAVIVSKTEEVPPGLTVIRISDPYAAFAELLSRCVVVERPVSPGVSPSAVVSPEAVVDETAFVGPCCVVENGARIGPRTRLLAQVFVGRDAVVGEDTTCAPHVAVLHGCEVGARCILHPGVVVGSDGFGFAAGPNGPRKVPQVGTVVIEDDVEIGANTTIDRAALGVTRIGRGVKLDNLVQIAHNVQVGEGTMIAAQTGVSGSARIGSGVRMAGQVGTIGHIEIGDGATLIAQSGVAGDVEPGSVLAGSPAMDWRVWKRMSVALSRLPDLVHRVTALERRHKSSEE
jgi:UDP-3-O-[3-hydroxymyristoyl] glucosamine N-acyltransferase